MGRKLGAQSNALFSTPPTSASPRWDQVGTWSTGQFLTSSPTGDLQWGNPTTGTNGALKSVSLAGTASPNSLSITATGTVSAALEGNLQNGYVLTLLGTGGGGGGGGGSGDVMDFNNVKPFLSGGVSTWTAPWSGTKRVRAMAFGSGATGSDTASSGAAGAGGGGAFAMMDMDIAGGTQLKLNVGYSNNSSFSPVSFSATSLDTGTFPQYRPFTISGANRTYAFTGWGFLVGHFDNDSRNFTQYSPTKGIPIKTFLTGNGTTFIGRNGKGIGQTVDGITTINQVDESPLNAVLTSGDNLPVFASVDDTTNSLVLKLAVNTLGTLPAGSNNRNNKNLMIIKSVEYTKNSVSYVASLSVGGTLWLSTNGAASVPVNMCQTAFSGYSGSSTFGAVANNYADATSFVADSNGNLYACNIFGVFKSADNGSNWTLILDTIDRASTETIPTLSVVNDVIYRLNSTTRVFQYSSDFGATWSVGSLPAAALGAVFVSYVNGVYILTGSNSGAYSSATSTFDTVTLYSNQPRIFNSDFLSWENSRPIVVNGEIWFSATRGLGSVTFIKGDGTNPVSTVTVNTAQLTNLFGIGQLYLNSFATDGTNMVFNVGGNNIATTNSQWCAQFALSDATATSTLVSFASANFDYGTGTTLLWDGRMRLTSGNGHIIAHFTPIYASQGQEITAAVRTSGFATTSSWIMIKVPGSVPTELLTPINFTNVTTTYSTTQFYPLAEYIPRAISKRPGVDEWCAQFTYNSNTLTGFQTNQAFIATSTNLTDWTIVALVTSDQDGMSGVTNFGNNAGWPTGTFIGYGAGGWMVSAFIASSAFNATALSTTAPNSAYYGQTGQPFTRSNWSGNQRATFGIAVDNATGRFFRAAINIVTATTQNSITFEYSDSIDPSSSTVFYTMSSSPSGYYSFANVAISDGDTARENSDKFVCTVSQALAGAIMEYYSVPVNSPSSSSLSKITNVNQLSTNFYPTATWSRSTGTFVYGSYNATNNQFAMVVSPDGGAVTGTTSLGSGTTNYLVAPNATANSSIGGSGATFSYTAGLGVNPVIGTGYTASGGNGGSLGGGGSGSPYGNGGLGSGSGGGGWGGSGGAYGGGGLENAGPYGGGGSAGPGTGTSGGSGFGASGGSAILFTEAAVGTDPAGVYNSGAYGQNGGTPTDSRGLLDIANMTLGGGGGAGGYPAVAGLLYAAGGNGGPGGGGGGISVSASPGYPASGGHGGIGGGGGVGFTGAAGATGGNGGFGGGGGGAGSSNNGGAIGGSGGNGGGGGRGNGGSVTNYAPGGDGAILLFW